MTFNSKKVFRFVPCALSIITGPSGSGKSMFAAWLMAAFLDAGGHVFSNVTVAQLQPDGKWDDTKRPERFHFVESWADFFHQLSEAMMDNPEGRALLIIDEAAAGKMAAKNWQDEAVQIAVGAGTLKRKWLGLHICFITMTRSLIAKKLRETHEEGGILDMTFMKDPWAIERWAQDLRDAGYLSQEIVVVSREELEEPEAFTFTFADQIARPLDICKPGDYAYHTLGQASWGTGRHPHAEKGKWNWAEFLEIQSGVWPDYIPRIMYDYWHKNPDGIVSLARRAKQMGVRYEELAEREPVSLPEPSLEDVDAEEDEDDDSGPKMQKDVAQEIERLLLERGRETNLSQIAREVGCTQPNVSQIKKRLIKEGRL